MNGGDEAEAGRWLDQAKADLADVRYLADGERFAPACFASQQAAGKALKAVLLATGADLVLGHGVGQLCVEVAKLAPECADRCREWAALDVFYIPTRYPDALPSGIPATSFSAGQATSALQLAGEVLDFAGGQVP